MNHWFDDLPVLGKLAPAEAADKLAELDEPELAARLREAEAATEAFRAASYSSGAPWYWPFADKPWQHTAHAFGYLAPRPRRQAGADAGQDGAQDIVHAGSIQPDRRLIDQPIKITLAALRTASYPGGGTHHVLFDFYAQNQVRGPEGEAQQDAVEHLHFNAQYRTRDGEHAAVLGYPIFLGLVVGKNGLSFRCYTVNIKNEEDEALLGFLDSDVFRAGLQLASTTLPAIAQLSTMAQNLTRAMAKRHRNVPVQEFQLGLDFNDSPLGARLAEGSYIAVQIPESVETVWRWDEWVYDSRSGRIVDRETRTQLIPYNYIAFNVSRYA